MAGCDQAYQLKLLRALRSLLVPIIIFSCLCPALSQKNQQAHTLFSKLELTRPDIIQKISMPDKENKTSDWSSYKIKSPSMAHRAIFCRIEDQVGRAAQFPLKIRLGSVAYTDAMEGKGIGPTPNSKGQVIQEKRP